MIIDSVPGVTRTAQPQQPQQPSRRIDITAAVLGTRGAGVAARRRGDFYARNPGVTQITSGWVDTDQDVP